MADYTKILRAIWREPRFTRLRSRSQSLYFLLLSHPTTVLDVAPVDFELWAGMSTDATIDELEVAFDELVLFNLIEPNETGTHVALSVYVKNAWVSTAVPWSRWSVGWTRRRRPLSRALRAYIISRDASVCGLCGQLVAPSEIDIDHIHPRSLGGSDDPNNLQVSHARCNRRKGARV